MDASWHDAGRHRDRRGHQWPDHRHRRGCRQSRDRATPEARVGQSYQRNRIHRAPRRGPSVPVGGSGRAGCGHHDGNIENSLGPTIAASQKGRPMGITHLKYKAAVVQAAPVWIDLEFTVAKTIRYIEEAAKEGAKLIAFPETWIAGSPRYIRMRTP